MFKKFYEKANTVFNILYGEKATIVSGIFLAMGIALHFLEITLPFDPIWLTIAISGSPILFFAIKYLVLYKKITSLVLISIGIISALAIGEIFAAAEVAWIMALGAILEDRTFAKTKTSIQKLISLVPSMARRVLDSKTEQIPAENVKQGDIIRILPGEQIPVDGKILAGSTSVNQAILTGESLPIDKAQGDEVFCGTLNLHGSVDIVCTNESKNSSLQKMVRLVEEASANNSPIQRIMDTWAVRLILIALAIAGLTFVFTGDLIRTVTVLVVFCPCAMALATPTSIMAAIGQASKHGVLVKSGHALEIMGNVNQIAFDKTGTLTTGKLTVTDIVANKNQTKEHVLQTCATAEQRSEHPLAKAVMEHYHNTSTQSLEQNGDFSMQAGLGVSYELANTRIRCGKLAYLKQNNITISAELSEQEIILRKQGKALIFVAENQECIGIVALADSIRGSARTSLATLHNLGIKTTLLTGDSKITADFIAKQIDIDTIHAELLPEEKVQKVQELQTQGNTVCMIGDGINDAPVLAGADVGAAMGSGADAAIEAADIVFMTSSMEAIPQSIADVGIAMGQAGSDISIEAADIALIGEDLNKVAYLKKLSNATVFNIKFNIAIALGINILAVLLGVFGIIGPVIGALTHNGGSILVIINAARLYDKKIG